ncbi:Armadillo-type fold [Phytophthora cactorum]|nr:Armadillo-type fold [Phytophthora cactorum]
MGQAGSVQQKSALRDVLALRRPNVSNTELEEVLRTFCALFPLELQVPVDADPNLLSNIVGVDVKERRLFDDQTEQAQRNNARDMTGLILTSFRRVIRWRELYKLCAKCSMKPFLACLSRPSPTLVLSVLETLQLMLSPCPGFETGDKAADRSEAANRRNFGDAGGFEVLRSLLENQKEDAAKVLEGVLKLFHLVLVKRRVATDMMACSQAVGALMNARVSLLDLCHCRVGDCAVMRLASALVKELFCIVDLDQVHELQDRAGDEESGKNVEDTDELELEMRELCVDLVEVFCAGNTRSKKTMYRIFPERAFLYGSCEASNSSSKCKNSAAFSFEFEQPRRTSIATSNVAATNANAENKRNRVVALAYNAMNFGGGAFERWIGDAREKGEHWRDIIEATGTVWRAPMRAELRQALQAEIETLERRRRCIAEDDSAQSGEQIPRWDHEMFYVEYPSMHDELVVNDYFVEYLIPRVADLSATYEIAEPTQAHVFVSTTCGGNTGSCDYYPTTICVEKLALLDGNSDYNSSSGGVSSRLSSASSPSLQSSSTSSHSSSTTDSNWRSLTLVYVLLASCDPKGMGMCVAAAEFLKECCVLPPASRGAGGTKNTYPPNELTDLLNDALGFGGCGMERLLNSASAEVFADTFNASQKRAADVNWGRKQRTTATRMTICSLGTSFCGPTLGGGEFLSEWTPEMFNELINALFEELVQLGRRKSAYTTGTGNIGPLPSPSRQPSLIQSSSSGGPCAAESWEVQVLILKALARLIPSHGAEVKIKSEFYEALLAPLRRSMLSEVDQVRGILSLDFLPQ